MRTYVKSGCTLTKREIEVLNFMTKGFSNPQIAKKLVITESTAKAHVSNILEKLSVKNRVLAIVKAIKSGIISS